jgi:hypothetical protein
VSERASEGVSNERKISGVVRLPEAHTNRACLYRH